MNDFVLRAVADLDTADRTIESELVAAWRGGVTAALTRELVLDLLFDLSQGVEGLTVDVSAMVRRLEPTLSARFGRGARAFHSGLAKRLTYRQVSALSSGQPSRPASPYTGLVPDAIARMGGILHTAFWADVIAPKLKVAANRLVRRYRFPRGDRWQLLRKAEQDLPEDYPENLKPRPDDSREVRHWLLLWAALAAQEGTRLPFQIASELIEGVDRGTRNLRQAMAKAPSPLFDRAVSVLGNVLRDEGSRLHAGIASNLANLAVNLSRISEMARHQILVYVLVATLDHRTTEICRFLDGMEFEVADALKAAATILADPAEAAAGIRERWLEWDRANGHPVLRTGQTTTRITGQGAAKRAGVLFPPFHPLCRTVVDRSMREERVVGLRSTQARQSPGIGQNAAQLSESFVRDFGIAVALHVPWEEAGSFHGTHALFRRVLDLDVPAVRDAMEPIEGLLIVGEREAKRAEIADAGTGPIGASQDRIVLNAATRRSLSWTQVNKLASYGQIRNTREAAIARVIGLRVWDRLAASQRNEFRRVADRLVPSQYFADVFAAVVLRPAGHGFGTAGDYVLSFLGLNGASKLRVFTARFAKPENLADARGPRSSVETRPELPDATSVNDLRAPYVARGDREDPEATVVEKTFRWSGSTMFGAQYRDVLGDDAARFRTPDDSFPLGDSAEPIGSYFRTKYGFARFSFDPETAFSRDALDSLDRTIAWTIDAFSRDRVLWGEFRVSFATTQYLTLWRSPNEVQLSPTGRVLKTHYADAQFSMSELDRTVLVKHSGFTMEETLCRALMRRVYNFAIDSHVEEGRQVREQRIVWGWPKSTSAELADLTLEFKPTLPTLERISSEQFERAGLRPLLSHLTHSIGPDGLRLRPFYESLAADCSSKGRTLNELWQIIRLVEPWVLGPGGQSSRRDDFLYSATAFLLYPMTLVAYCPLRYRYLQELVTASSVWTPSAPTWMVQ